MLPLLQLTVAQFGAASAGRRVVRLGGDAEIQLPLPVPTTAMRCARAGAALVVAAHNNVGASGGAVGMLVVVIVSGRVCIGCGGSGGSSSGSGGSGGSGGSSTGCNGSAGRATIPDPADPAAVVGSTLLIAIAVA